MVLEGSESSGVGGKKGIEWEFTSPEGDTGL